MDRTARFGRREGRTRAPRLERRRTTDQHALELDWVTMFSNWFCSGKHISILELESLISLLSRVTREGVPPR